MKQFLTLAEKLLLLAERILASCQIIQYTLQSDLTPTVSHHCHDNLSIIVVFISSIDLINFLFILSVFLPSSDYLLLQTKHILCLTST